MKTIGYGLVQIPVVTQYRVCCIRRTLKGGATSTGWQQIIACTIRIVLLSSWGMDSIDFSLPLTAHKIIGVYIELFILSLQVANGIVILFGLWSDNIFLLYPSCVLIPVCFLTDIIIKGSCYGELFLTHQVTVFGVFSLIEVWLRGFVSMYGWIIIISYIYYQRKDWDLTKVNVELNPRSPGRVSTLGRKTSSKSPFSRNSSLSRRGRQSFLLRKSSKKEENGKEGMGGDKAEQLFLQPNGDSPDRRVEPIYAEIAKKKPIGDHPSYPESMGHDTNSSFNNNTLRLTSESGRDGESEILLGESATMSMRRHPPPKPTQLSKYIATEAEERTHSPNHIFHKKRGGFVPDVLRTPSKLEKGESPGPPIPRITSARKHSSFSSHSESTTTANTIEFSSEIEGEKDSLIKEKAILTNSHLKQQGIERRNKAPTLPKKPPAGPVTAPPTKKESSFMTWISPDKKSQSNSMSETTTSMLQKHKQDPVLV